MSISIVDTFVKSMFARSLANNKWKWIGLDNMLSQ
jgi:hypothetical protein